MHVTFRQHYFQHDNQLIIAALHVVIIVSQWKMIVYCITKNNQFFLTTMILKTSSMYLLSL